MCTSVFDYSTLTVVESVGQIKALTSIVRWHPGYEDREIPDESCLCGVDVANTLVWAGYKVWADRDRPGDYCCEEVQEISD